MRRVLVVVIALVAAGCEPQRDDGSAPDALPRSVSKPGQPWLELLAAARAGDYAKAHAQMVASYRAAVSVDAFEAALRHNPLVAKHTDATTFSYGGGRGDGGSLHAEGAIATALGPVRFEVFYVKEAGVYRVLTLVVAGVPVVGVGVAAPAGAATEKQAP